MYRRVRGEAVGRSRERGDVRVVKKGTTSCKRGQSKEKENLEEKKESPCALWGGVFPTQKPIPNPREKRFKSKKKAAVPRG